MFDITKEYTVFCSICANWDRISGMKLPSCIKLWKKDGWKIIKGRFVCSYCQNSES